MFKARAAALVLLDASPFYRFCEAQLLPDLAAGVVVIDDLFGKRLARDRGVARLSTAQLVAEMVAERALADDDGFRVFDLSTPASAGREAYDRACARALSSGG